MPSAQASQLFAMFRSAPKQVAMDLAHQREAGEKQEDFSAEPSGVTYEDAPAVGGFWARPGRASADAALVYLYGGGYVISSPHSRRKFAGHLANASGAPVLVPRYRLAPEHPFPAAVDDATAAYAWVLGQPQRPQQLFIAGDSSGGGLAIATLLKCRDDRLPVPAGAVAISPWTDLACTGESLDTRAQADFTVTKASLLRMAAMYLHGADARSPLASPLYGALGGLPPLLVLAGGDEALLDDAVRIVRAAGIAGVDAELFIAAGMQHIFPVYCGAFPEADAAVARIGRWIRLCAGQPR